MACFDCAFEVATPRILSRVGRVFAEPGVGQLRIRTQAAGISHSDFAHGRFTSFDAPNAGPSPHRGGFKEHSASASASASTRQEIWWASTPITTTRFMDSCARQTAHSQSSMMQGSCSRVALIAAFCRILSLLLARAKTYYFPNAANGNQVESKLIHLATLSSLAYFSLADWNEQECLRFG